MPLSERAEKADCRPKQPAEFSALATTVGEYIIDMQKSGGSGLNKYLTRLKNTSTPGDLSKLGTYLDSTCHHDITQRLLPEGRVVSGGLEFGPTNSGHTGPASDTTKTVPGLGITGNILLERMLSDRQNAPSVVNEELSGKYHEPDWDMLTKVKGHLQTHGESELAERIPTQAQFEQEQAELQKQRREEMSRHRANHHTRGVADHQ